MLDNVCPYACWQRNARNAVDHGGSFALIEPVKGQGADVGAPKPSPIRLRAVGHYQQHTQCFYPVHRHVEGLKARGVDPL
jgi:hypothetical protein